jgi:hypothetical protein
MYEEIINKKELLAIIIKSNFEGEQIKFFTPDNFSQQLGYMNRPKGYVIPPHRHNIVHREVFHTQEVLFIKSGSVRVDFYDNNQVYIESRLLFKGDIILLAAGGHGFEMIEQSEIIEVKQGPYVGERDKVRFEHIAKHKVKLGNNG